MLGCLKIPVLDIGENHTAVFLIYFFIRAYCLLLDLLFNGRAGRDGRHILLHAVYRINDRSIQAEHECDGCRDTRTAEMNPAFFVFLHNNILFVIIRCGIRISAFRQCIFLNRILGDFADRFQKIMLIHKSSSFSR